MTTRQVSISVYLAFLALSAAPSSFAGEFRVTDVAYTVWPLPDNDEQVRILVTSTARYRGKVDHSDEDAIWTIVTHLNTSLSGDLYNWEFPEWTGLESTGRGVPYTNYVISCDLACAADAAVDKCDASNRDVVYLGHGAAGIYHVRGPEFHEAVGITQDTECLTFEVGGAVSGLPTNPDQPLILQNNGGDDLTISGNGSFVFPKELRDGDTYAVSIKQHPFGIRCRLAFESGTIDGADVTDVGVSCVNYCEARYSTVDYPADFSAAGAPQCSTASLFDNGDGTVTDLNNGLVWTKSAINRTGGSGYDSGSTYCEGLVIGGRDDWDVPDVAQLQTLLPVGTCDTALEDCWSDPGPGDDITESGIHWSKSAPPYLTYCPPGSGCRAHRWTVGLGPAELWGGPECWSGIGCRDPERVWWREVLEYHLVRCVTGVQ